MSKTKLKEARNRVIELSNKVDKAIKYSNNEWKEHYQIGTALITLRTSGFLRDAEYTAYLNRLADLMQSALCADYAEGYEDE